MASGEFEGQTGVPNALAHDLAAAPQRTPPDRPDILLGRCGRVRRVAVDRLWHERSDDASSAAKMTHRTTAEATDVIASLTHPVEYKQGVTLPSFAGLTARLYLDEYDAPARVSERSR